MVSPGERGLQEGCSRVAQHLVRNAILLRAVVHLRETRDIPFA